MSREQECFSRLGEPTVGCVCLSCRPLLDSRSGFGRGRSGAPGLLSAPAVASVGWSQPFVGEICPRLESRPTMPYLHCSECRLTVYSAARYSSNDACPRCAAALDEAPRNMFADGDGTDGAGNGRAVDGALSERRRLWTGGAPRAGSGPDRHALIRQALEDTGLFRDAGRPGAA